MGFFRVVLSGKSPVGAEVWSCGLSYIGPNTSIPQPDMQEWAQNVGVAIAATTGNKLIDLLSNAGNINQVRTEQRQETTEVLMTAGEYDLPIPKIGTGTPDKVLPNSFCISLLTGAPGRSRRGRVYWPAWVYSAGSTMTFSTTQLTDWLNAFVAINNIIKAQSIIVDPAYQMVLAVRSRLLHTSADVITAAGGHVPDTQRRRRDAIPEIYTSVTV